MSDSHDQNAAGGTPPVEPSANPEPQADAFQGTYDTGAETAADAGAGDVAAQHVQPAAEQYGQSYGEPQQPAAPQQYDPAQYDQAQYAQPTYGQAQYDPAQYDPAQFDQAQYAQPTYDQQGYAQQYAAPDQTAVAGFAPLVSPTAKSSGSNARNLLIVAAGLLPVLGAVLAYVLARWVDSSWAVFGGVGVVVATLAVAAALAPKYNAVPAFLAAAVATPFLLFACYGWGLNGAANDYLEDVATPFSNDDDDRAVEESDDLPTPVLPDEDEDSDEPSGETVALGKTGKVLGLDVTITTARCGLSQVENGADNPDSWEDGEPEYLTAKAPSGKEFCLIESTWKNTSKDPVDGFSLPEFGKITDSAGTSYAQTEGDREVTRYRSRSIGYDYDTVNPGDQVKIATVFTVPAGTPGEKVNTEGWDFGNTDEKYSVDFALK